MMQLGERVRKLRLTRGMTQTQVAGEHMTRNMLSQIENGSASPSVKTLEYLAQKLGVSVGYLMEEKSDGALAGAKKKFRSGDFDGALKAVGEAKGDEAMLLLTQIRGELAKRSFAEGDEKTALELAKQALASNQKTLYKSGDIELEMLRIIAHTEIESPEAETHFLRFKDAYDDCGWEAKNHLLRVRYYLEQHQNQAAEREIWMITFLPEREKANYLLLRGLLAVRQEKYTAALSYLKQVEAMEIPSQKMKNELYGLMEIAYREMQDFQHAYEYAAKQREH